MSAPGRLRGRAALAVATLLALVPLAPAASAGLLGDGGLLSLDGDDALVSVGGDDGLLGGDAGLLSSAASATATPSTLAPGQTVTVSFQAESANLLDLSLDEAITCTVTLPDGRTVPICDPATSELDVDLLGSGDKTLTYQLIAPDQPGTYTVTFATEAGLNVGGGQPAATTHFTVQEDDATPAGASSTSDAGGDGGEALSSNQQPSAGGDGGAGDAGGQDRGVWLLDHPWVLVIIAASLSVAAFTVAAHASPHRG